MSLVTKKAPDFTVDAVVDGVGGRLRNAARLAKMTKRLGHREFPLNALTWFRKAEGSADILRELDVAP